MIVSATAKNVRMSGQKVRIVVNYIRGCKLEKAIDILSFSNKKAAFVVKKLLRSVVANAEHNYGLDIDELIVHKACVNDSFILKRFKPRAKGRSNKIKKRNCHIMVEVKERK